VISTSAVDAYIEKHSQRFVDELKELCTFPSISNHGRDAIQPARDWLAERLGRFTDRVETLEAGGMPALYAEVKGAGRRKLLLYEHYDVQPVDPIALWDSPPFEPAEKDGRIIARGVADDKADVMARIHALETLKHLGEVPVTLRFLVEGEEEIGSQTFEKIIHAHAEKLRADGCLWESGSSFDDAGRPTLQFGCRGLLYVSLRVKMLDFDQHSGWASIYPSAAMYLIGALASLRDQDMNIKIDGFYDAVVNPTEPNSGNLERNLQAAAREFEEGAAAPLERVPIAGIGGVDRDGRDAAQQVVALEARGERFKQPLAKTDRRDGASNVLEQQQASAGSQHSLDLGDRRAVIGNGAQRQRAHDGIEARIGGLGAHPLTRTSEKHPLK